MRLQQKSSLSREAVKTRASALDANPVSSRLALIAPSPRRSIRRSIPRSAACTSRFPIQSYNTSTHYRWRSNTTRSSSSLRRPNRAFVSRPRADSDAFDRARVAHAQRYDVPELAFVPPGVL
jgi:hypothetical protein